jgi:nicotinate-nucleotide adenylyltransferase
MTSRRLGLLGGTFDPIHSGHVDAARAAETALGLTELLIVPSHIPPHRPQPAASAYHRFAMVALAVLGRPHWRASDLELREFEPSFTSATLDRLHAEGYAPTELFFVIGADAFAEIESWKNYPSIFERAHFAVVSRPSLAIGELARRLPMLAPRMVTVSTVAAASGGATSIFLIDAPTADVSSTAIRSRRAAGLSIAGQVPPSVQHYIEQHGLYTDTTPGAGAMSVRDEPAAGRLHGQN